MTRFILAEGCGFNTDPNELASDNEASDSDENEDSTGQGKLSSCSKQGQQPQKGVNGKRPQVLHYCTEVSFAPEALHGLFFMSGR